MTSRHEDKIQGCDSRDRVRGSGQLTRRGRTARSVGRLMVASTAALMLLVVLAPSQALAHAQLESTSPQRDGLVATQPKLVSFTFDESVGGTPGAVRVYDTTGKRVDDGQAFHPNGSGPTFGVGLKSGLPKGTYTATYRVVSADTHIVTGGFVFAIGARSPSAGSTVGQLLSGQKTGTVTSTAFTLAKAVQYGSIGVGVGLLAFLLLVWVPVLATTAGGTTEWRRASASFVARLRRALLVAAACGVLSAIVAVILQGAQASGVTFWSALDTTILKGVVGTRFGAVWTGAAVAWLLVGLATTGLLRPRAARGMVLEPAHLGADGAMLDAPVVRPSLGLLALPLVALIALPALAGHASVQSPVWLFLPANLAHVSAMSLWIGGLVALTVALPAATRQLEGHERTRALSAVLERFSPLALIAVIVLLTTGTLQALLEINAWSELLHTAFGRAVLIKVGLLIVLIAFGALNRRSSLPRLRALAEGGDETPGATGVVLRRTLRAEVAVIAIVLVVSGALSGYAPAKDADTGPVSITSTLGPTQLSLDVDPASVGSNVIHIYLLDPKSGAQYDKTKQLTVTAALPSKGIGPLTLDAQSTGPGHYTIPSAVLGAPGTWTLDLTARVSAFDEFEHAVKVRIR
jgi:copper transport protein